MTLTQRLDLRQTTALVMTPQLQQAIKLLQMSNQELAGFIATEMERNPLLERPETPTETPVAIVPTEADAPTTITTSAPKAEPPSPPPTDEHLPYSSASFSSTSIGASSHAFDDDDDFAQNIADESSLRDHLLSQIHMDFSDPAERLIAAALVEFVDEAGYLPPHLDVVRAQLGAPVELFESVIARLQRLDPAGIFARSLTECLAIQLREKDRLDPAMQTLLQHLDLVAKREHKALMRLCGVDAEDLAQMIREIRALDPKPALAFTSDVAPPVLPDVILMPVQGGGWQVELNNDTLPRVLANERYYTQVKNAARAKPDKDYVSERWQQANWLVKALHQRATTILKVAAEIVRRQDRFFVEGVQHLRPLILRDIAEAVEMHESTVSRVTQNKYIATPRGLFELKYFFTNAIATTGGVESVAATAVRERIRAIIEEEDPDNVLSDDQIVISLRLEGIDIARRTVAKYREALRIASSAQRRRDKRIEAA